MNFEEFKKNRQHIAKELNWQAAAKDDRKDILVVVHNQLDYVQTCIQTLQEHTSNYRLYVWDNASDQPTKTYLERCRDQGLCTLTRSEENLGFIKPNNLLFEQGSSPYVILLNSDTQVGPHWSEAILGGIQQGYAIVGYEGCRLNSMAEGGLLGSGEEIDYVSGWCLGVSREIVKIFGNLFDSDHLEFAYGEDSDLSLRFREQGYSIYALHLKHVVHHENKTVNEVRVKREEDLKRTFAKNHEYLRQRWSSFLPRSS